MSSSCQAKKGGKIKRLQQEGGRCETDGVCVCGQITKLDLLRHFETTGDQVQSSLENHVDNFVERIHSRLTDPLRQRIQNIRRELQASFTSN